MTKTDWSSPAAFAGRLMMAAVFAPAGYGKLIAAGATAQYMGSAGLPVSAPLAALVGLFEIAAALLLVVGFKTRGAALSLCLFTLLASMIFHAFWSSPPEQQFVQQLLFVKNMGVAGGLLLLAALGGGRWAIDAGRSARQTPLGPRATAP